MSRVVRLYFSYRRIGMPPKDAWLTAMQLDAHLHGDAC